MGCRDYNSLKAHVGHRTQVVGYGPGDNPENVAVECLDCGEVLLDFDRAPAGRHASHRRWQATHMVQVSTLPHGGVYTACTGGRWASSRWLVTTDLNNVTCSSCRRTKFYRLMQELQGKEGGCPTTSTETAS